MEMPGEKFVRGWSDAQVPQAYAFYAVVQSGASGAAGAYIDPSRAWRNGSQIDATLRRCDASIFDEDDLNIDELDFAAKRHRDTNNLGPSVTGAIGDFRCKESSRSTLTGAVPCGKGEGPRRSVWGGQPFAS